MKCPVCLKKKEIYKPIFTTNNQLIEICKECYEDLKKDNITIGINLVNEVYTKLI